MTAPIPEEKLLYLSERGQWRDWLEEHYKSENDIWLVYARKHTGRPRIEYNDAVEEALCFGWIDSIVRTVDEDHYAQRFSVRKAKSNYSQANKERLRVLVSQGLVIDEVLERLPDVSGDDFVIPEDILAAIQEDEAAWKNFQSFSGPYVRIRVAYIDAARKRPGEFEKRLANFIKKTGQNKLFGYGGIEKYF